MSLDVQIKIPAGDALTTAKKVEDALDGVETAGEKAGEGVAKGMRDAHRALTNLSNGFRGLEAVMNARARATEVHSRLNNNLANSFAGVAQQIAREKQILDSIHGPMQRYEQDVRTLAMLHERGAISASQHAAALAKARAAAGMGNASSAVSLAGGAAAATAAAKDAADERRGQMFKGLLIAGGIAGTAKQVIDLTDSYTSLENRMRQVASSQAELSSLMDRVGQIANRTRSDIGTTGESFVRLVQATKQLGVSQERGLKITETLNMALQSSGASATEASAGTLQLMQAMAAGALQGDEFRSLAENMPQLLDVFAKQLGVTRSELKQMGADGKITTDIMIKGLEGYAAQAKKTFDESEMTFGQAATVLKNYATEALGGGISITKAWNNWGAATQALRLEEIELGNAMARVHPMFGTLISDATGMTAATYALTKSQLQHMENTDRLVRSLVMLGDQMKIIKALQRDANFKAFGEDLGLDLTAAGAAGEKNAEAKRRAREEARREKTFAFEHDTGFSSRSALEMSSHFNPKVQIDDISEGISAANIEAITLQRHLEHVSLQAKKYELDMASANDGVARGFNRISEEIANTAQLMENTLVNAFHGFEDAMVNAALTGEFSFSRMVDQMMADLARLAMRQLAMAALTAAMGGGGGGLGATALGGTILDPGAWKGFATGGSFMVGGNGSTDTTPVAFMATPGEKVTIETPEQQRSGDSQQAPQGAQPVVMYLDQRAFMKALESPMGATVLDNVLRKNPGLLRR